MPRGVEDPGPVLAKPEKLWRLHLGRDDAAYVFQDVVAGRVDPFGLVDCPVVHPDDNVAGRVLGKTDWQRGAALAQHDERAGGVEADAADLLRADAEPLARCPDRAADRLPDLGA